MSTTPPYFFTGVFLVDVLADFNNDLFIAAVMLDPFFVGVVTATVRLPYLFGKVK